MREREREREREKENERKREREKEENETKSPNEKWTGERERVGKQGRTATNTAASSAQCDQHGSVATYITI